MELRPSSPKPHPVHVSLIVAIVVIVAGAGYVAWWMMRSTTPPPSGNTATAGLKQFSSDEEVAQYIADGQARFSGSFFSSVARRTGAADDRATTEVGLGQAEGTTTPSIPTADRYSTTNIQVAGVDEPDILKTDGEDLYISSEQQYLFEKVIAPGSIASPDIAPVKAATAIVAAVPVEQLKKRTSIDQTGPLLLSEQRLMVFGSDGITGFDVVDPNAPQQLWKDTYGESTSLVSARLVGGKMYVVTQKYSNSGSPCPVAALKTSAREISIPCTELYHPIAPVAVNGTYVIMRINPADGQVEDSVSVLADSGTSVISVFPGSLYLAYTITADPTEQWFEFYATSGRSLFPADLQEKFDLLQTYDISTAAKMTELSILIEQHVSTLDEAAQQKFQKDLEKRLQKYTLEHRREFEQTGLVRIDLPTLTPAAAGTVAGHLLNQFSMDEFAGHLRVATTTSGWYFGSADSVNDVYVLDHSLKQVGQVLDLGQGEQIYSVRFVGNRGYVVTFRQTDPFFVLDLTEPTAPKKTGELKIPGYSAYLHPIDATTVLGIGQDGSAVKASLFDVADPAAPKELSSINLASGWTDIQYNHHAFLLDTKHSVFFVPASQQGFVVSYANRALSVVKTVTDLQAQRALYINDALYIIGTDRLIVLDENTWGQVAELSF